MKRAEKGGIAQKKKKKPFRFVKFYFRKKLAESGINLRF